MKAPLIVPDQYILETLPEGGILLDLDSSILFSLNRTATFVWERALRGDQPPQISRELADVFDVSESSARSDVGAAMHLPASQEASGVRSDFLYEAVETGFRFSLKGTAVLDIAVSEPSVRVVGGATPPVLNACLRAIAPKLVTLLGGSVLHASAVARPDGKVLAFLGASGAGKTTTARMFAQAGWPLVCEDKLVLRIEGGRAVAALGGEALIEQWIEQARSLMTAGGPGTSCNLNLLKESLSPATSPIAEVALIDNSRRNGSAISVHRLNPLDAAARVFWHAFYGSPASNEWRRQLRVAAVMARTLPVREVTMPEGLAALEIATRHYTETTAS